MGNLTFSSDDLNKQYDILMKQLGKYKTMVLSTALNDKVTSRMMSFVIADGLFYFQTDRNFRKYEQIHKNPKVSLCIDNIQIEGICTELGHPTDHVLFCELYQECFQGSYANYSSLLDERLFVIKPSYIQRWLYENTIPFIEIFDLDKKLYEKKQYENK